MPERRTVETDFSVLQRGNESWWTRNAMSYDWNTKMSNRFPRRGLTKLMLGSIVRRAYSQLTRSHSIESFPFTHWQARGCLRSDVAWDCIASLWLAPEP